MHTTESPLASLYRTVYWGTVFRFLKWVKKWTLGWAFQVIPRTTHRISSSRVRKLVTQPRVCSEAHQLCQGHWPCLFPCVIQLPARPCRSPSASQNVNHTTESQQHRDQEIGFCCFIFSFYVGKTGFILQDLIKVPGLWYKDLEHTQITSVHKKALTFSKGRSIGWYFSLFRLL